MNEDLKIIKKKYGEDMAHFCREYFPILLEAKGLLSNLLLKKFEPSKFLYSDIVKANLEERFKNFIYSLVDVENVKEEESTKSPRELLNEADYDLYECRTEEEIQSFKKYYAKDEELCTFRGGRLKSCYVYFAVKHDVDDIKREDFKNPQREDLYGTSVISIQFTKDETHLLSIKNRYNHRVNNPDATFSNNLDNIIPGLTKSFEDFYGMKQTVKSHNFEIPNYVLAKDGKYYKYNFESGCFHYCPNNIIIDINGVHRFDPSKYIVLDYFILDLVSKKIYLNDRYIEDSFPDAIGEIEKIEILKTDYGKEIRITNKNNEISIIKIDKENKLIGYTNENIKRIEKDFLVFGQNLEELNLPNVIEIGNGFLNYNKKLKEISLLKVEKIGEEFLSNNQDLEKVNLPNVKWIGIGFLGNNENLKELNLPVVEEINDYFIYTNRNLKNLNLPNVRKIGSNFLSNDGNLEELNLPMVKEIGAFFLYSNKSLKVLNLPNVVKIGDNFLASNRNLEELNLLKVEKIGQFFLYNNRSLKEISLPNVVEIGNDFLSLNTNELTINTPKLLIVHNSQNRKLLFEIVEENKKRLEMKEDKSI